MSEGPEHAPAGWYNDPHAPDRMRYFDGEMWTNHFHEPGKLPDIGNWLSTTFSSIGQFWKGAVALTLVTTLVGNVGFWIALRAVVGDVAVVDEQLVNLDSGVVVVLLVLILFAFLWQGIGWVATSRFMQRAHFQAEPSVGEALQHAVRRLPRYVGVVLALILGFIGATFIVGLLAAIAPILGLMAVLALLVGLVWAFVKMAFVVVAITAAPPGTSPFQASASVSTNRFWPVLGRLLLLVVGIWIASTIITTALGEYGQFVDAEVMTDIFQVDGDTLFISDFRLVDLLPSSGRLMFVLILNSIVQGAASLVSASAFMRLYLDSGAPSEI